MQLCAFSWFLKVTELLIEFRMVGSSPYFQKLYSQEQSQHPLCVFSSRVAQGHLFFWLHNIEFSLASHILFICTLTLVIWYAYSSAKVLNILIILSIFLNVMFLFNSLRLIPVFAAFSRVQPSSFIQTLDHLQLLVGEIKFMPRVEE